MKGRKGICELLLAFTILLPLLTLCNCSEADAMIQNVALSEHAAQNDSVEERVESDIDASNQEGSQVWNLQLHTAASLAEGIVLSYKQPYSQINLHLTLPTQDMEASTSYNLSNGRIVHIEDDDGVTLAYCYGAGRLTALTRAGNALGIPVSQTYRLYYDGFGRIAGLQVGTMSLSSIKYADNGGPPLSFRFENGDTVSYAYDPLGRLVSVANGSEQVPLLRIRYGEGGQICEINDCEHGTTYSYAYDAFGRLTRAAEYRGHKPLQVTQIIYDNSNRVFKINYQLSHGRSGELSEKRSSVFYYHEDGTLKCTYLPNGSKLIYQYLDNQYISSKETEINGRFLFEKEYEYELSTGNNSPRITTLSHSINGRKINSICYQYDSAGNLSSMAGHTESNYGYDSLGQLVTEEIAGKVTQYTYDTFGNLRFKTEEDSMTECLYENDQWPDLLTSYNGHSIFYDEIGNPVKWFDGSEMVWASGKQLKLIINHQTGKELEFTYNCTGQRLSKFDGNYLHEYVWQGDKLLLEQYGNIELEFFYDENDHPCGFRYSYPDIQYEVDYYYLTDALGSVIQIIDSYGNVVASYGYNAWGKLLYCTGDIAEINPIRYRGYYYDEETGLYYIHGRYYSPEICRYINASDSLFLQAGVLGTNLFVYDNNNPLHLSVQQSETVPGECEVESPAAVKEAPAPRRPSANLIELTEEQKIFVSTIYSEVGFNANGVPASPIVRQCLANVIMNRVGRFEWSEYTTVAEVCEHTGFYGFKNDNYQFCMDYLNERDGWDFFIEEIIDQVLPIYNKEVDDISGGALLFYTPAVMDPPGSEPDWNFYLLEEIILPGVDPENDGRFFKYK